MLRSRVRRGDVFRSSILPATDFTSDTEFLKNQTRTSFKRFAFSRIADHATAFRVKIHSRPKTSHRDRYGMENRVRAGRTMLTATSEKEISAAHELRKEQQLIRGNADDAKTKAAAPSKQVWPQAEEICDGMNWFSLAGIL